MKKDKNLENIKLIKSKKSRNTFLVFSALFATFAALAVVFGTQLPKFTSISDVEGEKIRTTTYSTDGNDFLVYSDFCFDYRNVNTNETYEKVNYVDQIKSMLEEEGKTDSLLKGSFNEMTLDLRQTENQKILIVSDNVFNMFKYVLEDNHFILTKDYYLRETSSVLKFATNYGNEYYAACATNNNLALEKYDMLNLAAGPSASKYLWDYTLNNDNTFTLKHIESNMKYWDIQVDESYIYICENRGVVRISKEFCDYEGISFIESAKTDYTNIYLTYLRDQIRAADPEVAKDYYDLTALDSLTKAELEKNYKKATGESLTDAKKAAKTLFLNNHTWCKDYDPNEVKVTVKNEYYDKTKVGYLNASIITNPAKIVYNPNNKEFVVASFYDDSLYTVDVEDIKSTGILDDKDLDSFAKKVENLSFDNKKFSTTNPMEFNKASGCLYLSFASSDVIDIISTKDGVYERLYSFKANYDTLSFVGNADNSQLYYVIYDKNVALDGSITTFKTLYNVNPQKTTNQGFMKLAMILCGVFAFISLVGGIVSLLCWQKPSVLEKTITIAKDVKKNKWIYIALIPFVFALIMCCYYEAVGSISLSFFDYTRDNPAMKWNNFANYIHVFNDEDFLLSVGNMLFFLVGDLFFSLVPPLLYAFFLSTMNSKRYSKLIRSLLLIPGIIPGIAGLLIWRMGIFGQYGVLNTIITLFNGEYVEFLANSDIARWSLLLMGFPYVGGYLIIYGGLMNIPKDYYEEAELSGCRIARRFFKIDLPLVMPQLKYIFVMTFIGSVQNYQRTYMLKSLGTVTPAEKMYIAMNSLGADYGLASAYATLIFLFLLAAIIADFKMQRKSYLGEN